MNILCYIQPFPTREREYSTAYVIGMEKTIMIRRLTMVLPPSLEKGSLAHRLREDNFLLHSLLGMGWIEESGAGAYADEEDEEISYSFIRFKGMSVTASIVERRHGTSLEIELHCHDNMTYFGAIVWTQSIFQYLGSEKVTVLLGRFVSEYEKKFGMQKKTSPLILEAETYYAFTSVVKGWVAIIESTLRPAIREATDRIANYSLYGNQEDISNNAAARSFLFDAGIEMD
jgi:hypothetical protein